MKKLVWVLFILWILVIISSGCGSPTPKNLTPPIITAVAGGGGHTLALTSTGKLYAWGLNNKGQLGNGSTSNTDSPLEIALPQGVSFVALAAGSAHSVALTSTGQVYTWGWNEFGQLGIGSNAEPHTPTLVPGLNGVIAISARYNHTVVLKDDGSVWAWGRNNYGQLGNNDALKQDRNSPVQVVGVNGTGVLSNIQAIATGMGHTVALGEDRCIYSWGNNAFGQLGDGTTNNHLTPVKALIAPASAAIGNVKVIAAGDWHTLAQKTNGEIYAWGDNAHGQLSQPIPEPLEKNFNEIPTLISGHDVNITGALAIDTGSNYSAVLLSGGKVCGWGGNGNGELGIEATDEHEEPMYAHLPSGVTVNFFSAGTVHMLAVTPGGALYVWGSNYFGQLGIGGNTNSLIPKLVNF